MHFKVNPDEVAIGQYWPNAIQVRRENSVEMGPT